VIHTENNENKLNYEDISTEDGLEEQRALFVNQLLQESERDKAITAGLDTMSLQEARAEALRLRDQETKWIERIVEQAKREGKAGSDLSTYIMTKMNEPDEGQIVLKKRLTLLLNMIVHKTSDADREIHRETDKSRQVALLIETYGLRLLTRARFPKDMVQYMDGRGLIIRDKRPPVDKRKPQDLYFTEPTVIPINNNSTLGLIHELYADIVDEIKARSEERRAPRQEGEALVLPFGDGARELVPRVKRPGDSIFAPGLYKDAYLKGENGEEDRVLDLDFRDGAFYASKEDKEPLVELRRVGTSEKVYDMDHGLLMAIYTECMTKGQYVGGSQHTIKLSSLMTRMEKNGRGMGKEKILEKIRELNTTWTAIPNKPDEKRDRSFYWLMSASYNEKTDLLLVTMDFFLLYNGTVARSFLQQVKKRAGKSLKGDIDERIAKLEQGKPSREGHHSLAMMSLSSVKNKAAYYLVLSILDLISSAGVRVPRKTKQSGDSKPKREPVKRIHKTFQDLIEGNTVLKHRLSMAKSDNDRNKTLSRTFKKAYEYLREHTRIYEYYKDLHIDEEKMIPSMTDVKKGASFRCTHKGKIESPSEVPPSDK